ncbi:bifunctional diguanylate cyclase/phosphodiesterase [Lyngbya confervoides]|uniref:EAL domain-containing protein n=1 Tax=Lyngbya confervoides BDU141951 TaxID=1574623 RepID=A0ABD4SYN8_9CYAN|nr:EAL domain-containing protein [Lyngbya confervoides]MCM1981572.1 EAL domain-containing protein [Lyngbya confervoides BDU141951]
MIRKWKLRDRILCVMALLSTPLMGLVILDLHERQQVRQQEAEDQVQAIANRLDFRFNRFVEDSRSQVRLLSRLSPFRDLEPRACDLFGLPVQPSASLYANVLLVNRQGQVICSAISPPETALPSLEGQDWFKQASDRQSFIMSEPFFGPLVQQWVIMFSYPILDAEDEWVGVVGLPVTLESLSFLSAYQQRHEGVSITVTDAGGWVIAKSPDPEQQLGKNLQALPFPQPSLRNKLGTYSGLELDGTPQVYHHQTLSQLDWHAYVGLSLAAVQAPVEQQIYRVLLVCGVVSGGAIAFATLLSRQVLRPLQHLTPTLAVIDADPRVTPLEGPPEVRSVVAKLLDAIAMRKVADQRRLLLAKVFSSTCEAILIADQDLKIIAVNQTFETMTGYSEREVLGQGLEILAPCLPDQGDRPWHWLDLLKAGDWQGEVWQRRKSGVLFPTIQSISRIVDASGQTYVVSFLLDISHQREIEDRLNILASSDPLTGLPNRRMFMDRLARALARNQRNESTRVAVMVLNIDRFRDINNALGYGSGDALLVALSHRLMDSFRVTDTIARAGSDEFLMMAEELTGQEALLPIIQKIQAAFREPFQIQGRDLEITFSLGISLHPDHSREADELMGFADAAMDRAKRQGKGRYAFYTESMTQETEQRLQMERDLRRAIAHQELFLLYQPQLSLRTSTLVGCEALVRWQHPQRGLISPARFIPLALQTDLIEPLTDWVLQAACRQIVEWQARSRVVPPVGINLSGKSLGRTNYVALVQQLIADHHLSPSQIGFEITEDALPEDLEQVRTLIDQLQALGCKVAIDDFGTGYSSLSYLKHLGANVLKIDRSFVSQIDHDVSNQEIARAIIAVGHALQMQVLAEGVEREAEQEWLRAAGCDMIQGFYYAKPMAGSDLAQYFS